jgi:hypothetical protein
MKKSSTIAAFIFVALGFIFFDQVIVFLLSGFIPGTNFSISATTMLAVIISSSILMLTLKYRCAVYQNCLKFYDNLVVRKNEKDDMPEIDTKAKLPRRRYQEL